MSSILHLYYYIIINIMNYYQYIINYSVFIYYALIIEIYECSEKKIDRESFKCLSEELIKNIFHKAGPQAKFLSKWKFDFEGSIAESSVKRVRNYHIFS